MFSKVVLMEEFLWRTFCLPFVTWGKKTKTHYLPLSLPQQQKGDKAGLK
jgi:hypothetical protein